jgi:hypothetical protein
MKKQLFILTTTIFTFTATAQIPNYVPTNGLVGWWPFNGNANDESGNGNNGTANGATLTTDRFGNANKAFDFNAFNWNWGSGGDNIYIPYNQNFNSSQITVSVWFKKSANYITNQTFPTIIKRFEGGYNNPNGQTWGIHSNTNGDLLNTFILPPNTTNNYTVTLNQIGPVISSNEWHNVVISFDNQSLKTYYDGQLFGSVPANGMLINTNGNSGVSVGMSIQANGNWDPFNGIIDDIGIWNRALTACEIQDLYNAELNSLAVNGGPDQELCEGQSTSLFGTGASTYQWSNNVQNGVGFVPTATTSYILTGTDANGCVGTDTVSVIVNNTSSSSQTQTALDSYIWPVNGQTYTQSGTYTETLTNAAGCDSIVTLDLTLSFTGIDEINPNPSKKLLKITDLNGKETPFKKNTVLLFIYEDGTVERVFEGE